MNQLVATIVYCFGIIGLFVLNRDEKAETSKALWIPVIWLLITGSRAVSSWFHSGPTVAEYQFYQEGSPVDATIFGLLELAAVAVLWRRRWQVSRFLKSNWPILIFLVFCLVSTMWSDFPFIALKRWSKSIGDYAMILVVLTEKDPIAATKRFLCRVGFILIPLSILFIKYYPNIGRSYNPWTWEPMYGGVTTFKNLLGMITLVCALAALWCFLEVWRNRKTPRRRYKLIALGTVLSMSIWIFRMADSATSLACFVLAGTVLLLSRQGWVIRNPRLIHLLVAGTVGISLLALFFDSSGAMVGTLGRNTTLTGRTMIWALVLSMVKQPIIGTGFESFWLGDRLQNVWAVEKEIQEAHNGYIEMYLNLGWAGLILLSTMIVMGYRNVMSVYRRNPEMGSIKLAYLVAGLIYSLTEAGFRPLSPAWIAFLLAIIVIPPGVLTKRPAKTAPQVKAERVKQYPAFVAARGEQF
jgi:exopolysaccharide production protein ExoQ